MNIFENSHIAASSDSLRWPRAALGSRRWHRSIIFQLLMNQWPSNLQTDMRYDIYVGFMLSGKFGGIRGLWGGLCCSNLNSDACNRLSVPKNLWIDISHVPKWILVKILCYEIDRGHTEVTVGRFFYLWPYLAFTSWSYLIIKKKIMLLSQF